MQLVHDYVVGEPPHTLFAGKRKLGILWAKAFDLVGFYILVIPLIHLRSHIPLIFQKQSEIPDSLSIRESILVLRLITITLIALLIL